MCRYATEEKKKVSCNQLKEVYHNKDDNVQTVLLHLYFNTSIQCHVLTWLNI